MPDKANKKRVPLTPEELEARRIARNRSSAKSHKRSGYAAQKKYRATHKEEKRRPFYAILLRVPAESKPVFERLSKDTGLTITELVICAIEEKYSIDLRRSIDKPNDA